MSLRGFKLSQNVQTIRRTPGLLHCKLQFVVADCYLTCAKHPHNQVPIVLQEEQNVDSVCCAPGLCHAQPQLRLVPDPLPVSYPRKRLPRFQVGRLLVPYPSLKLFRLLRSQEPLHGHLPSPAVLLILVLARLMRPKRRVTAHWHCFLERSPGISGRFFGLYQRLALLLVPHLTGVVTTSPVLKQELVLELGLHLWITLLA